MTDPSTPTEQADRALIAFAESVNAAIAGHAKLLEILCAQVDSLREDLAGLDDATPSRRAFEELHTRVDGIDNDLTWHFKRDGLKRNREGVLDD